MTSKLPNVSLPRDQASVLAFVLKRVEAEDEIEILEFSLAGEFSEPFRVAVLGIGVDDSGRSLNAVVTLPLHSNGVFIAITAGKVREVARMLANLEDYERDSACKLRPLECVVADVVRGVKALFLLRTASYDAFAGIPDTASINDKEVRFSLVIGLDESEYATKNAAGVDGLLDRFQESEKSLLFFEAE